MGAGGRPNVEKDADCLKGERLDCCEFKGLSVGVPQADSEPSLLLALLRNTQKTLYNYSIMGMQASNRASQDSRQLWRLPKLEGVSLDLLLGRMRSKKGLAK